MLIVLLTSIVNASNDTQSSSNQICEIQPTLIHLYLNEYSKELYYYPFEVKLDKCVGSCNTLNDLSYKVCVPSKTKVLNIHVLILLQKKMNQKF